MRTMCPYCYQEFEVKEEYLDQTVACADCNRTFTVQKVKNCPRCGAVNPQSGKSCRKCHLDLTSAAAPPSPPPEKEAESEKTVSPPEREGNGSRPLLRLLKTMILFAILAAVVIGGWMGYRYLKVGKKQAEESKKVRDIQKEVQPKLLELESEIKNSGLGINLDGEARQVSRVWADKANEVLKTADAEGITRSRTGFQYDPSQKKRAMGLIWDYRFYDELRYISYYGRLRNINLIRVRNIDDFIGKYNGIMSSAQLPPLPDGVQRDLRRLVLLSRSDADTVLKLKHFTDLLKNAKEPAEIAESMNRDIPTETKEKLLIIYLNNRGRSSADVEEIMSDENFPRRYLTFDEISQVDRLAKEKFPAGGTNKAETEARKRQFRQKLMMDILNRRWRRNLKNIKEKEYQEALRYHQIIRDRLEIARERIFESIIHDNLQHFSYTRFEFLERDKNDKDVSAKAKARAEEEYERLLNFAQNSPRKISVRYYDQQYFRFCNDLFVQLMRYGDLKPEYPPPNWEKYFPESEQPLRLSFSDDEERKKYRDELDVYERRMRESYRKREADLTNDLSATEVLAEIERVDGIIERLSRKPVVITNCELFEGVFLFPEKQ